MKYQLIIIGGGVAGITAAVYASRKKIKTAVITSNFLGQTGRAGLIENYPGEIAIDGEELAKRFENHLKSLPIDIFENQEVNSVVKKDDVFKITGKDQLFSDTVIVATGRNPRPIRVKGEDDFLGKGVFYSAPKDTSSFKNKTVAIIGGGDVGFKTALQLKDECQKIYILEISPHIRAEEVSVDKAKETENIEIINEVRLKEIKGEENVSSIVCVKYNKEEVFSVDAIFIEVGSDPASSFVGNLVDFNEKGEIIVDSYTGETKTKGLFAAGDVTNSRDKQITVACGEGVRALISVYNYL